MIKAIIFDMDGVISDTQKNHSQAEADILNDCGIKITPDEITASYSSVRVEDIFSDLFKRYNIQADIEALAAKKRQMLLASLKKEVTPIEGIHNLVKVLHNSKYKLAVGTTSSVTNANIILKTLKLSDKFSFVASGHDVKNGKPAPDIFLLAAKKLQVKPQECLVIEDGLAGMQAAKNANMKCIGLVKEKNKKYPADILVNKLADVSLGLINKL